MSRSGRDRRLRLRLFELGNNRCPICLTDFTEADVREGETVEIEHVPAKSLNAGGFAMCLTCAGCNNRASKMEKAVAETTREEAQGEWKARVDIPGMPPQTARASFGGRVIMFPTNAKAHYEAMPEVLRQGKSFRMQWQVPTPRGARAPWLKAAYLSVFSLLGEQGYGYAQGEAIEQVRRQIMEPGEPVIDHFHFKAPPSWKARDGILMNREQRPCWIVKMGGHMVFLPQNWDASLYEYTKCFPIRLGGGPLWYPAQFGRIRTGLAPPRDFEDDPFGRTGMVSWEGKVTPIVVADCTPECTIVMSMEGMMED